MATVSPGFNHQSERSDCLCTSTGTLKSFHPSLKANPNSYLWEATVSATSVKGDVRSEARKHTSTLDQLSLGWLTVSHWLADPCPRSRTRWGLSPRSPCARAGAMRCDQRTTCDQQRGAGHLSNQQRCHYSHQSCSSVNI